MRWLIVLALAGCASGTFERNARQDEAEAIVWYQLYGEHCDPPPVEWIDGWLPGGYSGLALAGWKVQVMRVDGWTKDGADEPWVFRQFSSTSFAHELMHYHTYLRTGDIDAAHWRGDWELSRIANDYLRDADL